MARAIVKPLQLAGSFGQHRGTSTGENIRKESGMLRHPQGAWVVFWVWVGVIAAGFVAMAVILMSGR